MFRLYITSDRYHVLMFCYYKRNMTCYSVCGYVRNLSKLFLDLMSRFNYSNCTLLFTLIMHHITRVKKQGTLVSITVDVNHDIE